MTVTLYTSDSTAEQGDYWVGGGASFGDGQTEVEIWPFAYDDSDPDDEIFYVGIMDAGSYAINWNQSQAEVTIEDDDPVTVSLDGMVNVIEGEYATINVTRNTTEGEMTVYFRVVDASAEPEDYTLSMVNSQTAADGSTIYSATIGNGATSTAFTIEGADDEDGDDETLSIEVLAPDDGSYAPGMNAWITIEDREAPVATDKQYVTFGDGTAAGNLLTDDTGNGQDSDPNGDALTVVAQSSPTNFGNVTTSQNGDFTYTANLGVQGTDTFYYTLLDSTGQSAVAMVTVHVVRYNNIDLDLNQAPGDSEETEDTLGALVAVNYNDNDDDGYTDLIDADSNSDDMDLIEIEVVELPADSGNMAKLFYDDEVIRVYKSRRPTDFQSPNHTTNHVWDGRYIGVGKYYVEAAIFENLCRAEALFKCFPTLGYNDGALLGVTSREKPRRVFSWP